MLLSASILKSIFEFQTWIPKCSTLSKCSNLNFVLWNLSVIALFNIWSFLFPVLLSVSLTLLRRVQTKLSIATANESKQQLNSSIIYNLDSIARVNERKQRRKNGKFVKNLKNVRCRGLNLRRLSVPYVARSSNQLSHRDYWKYLTQKSV